MNNAQWRRDVIRTHWSKYYPQEACCTTAPAGSEGGSPPKLVLIEEFAVFFAREDAADGLQAGGGAPLLRRVRLATARSVHLPFAALVRRYGAFKARGGASAHAHAFVRAQPRGREEAERLRDQAEKAERAFVVSLRMQPADMLGIIGLALCLVRATKMAPQAQRRAPMLTPRITGLGPLLSLSDVCTEAIGRFVSCRGTVLRVRASRPLALQASFLCRACRTLVPAYFPDGFFHVVTRCTGDGCRSQTLQLDRSSAVVVDHQRVLIQETGGAERGSDAAGHMPRNLEVEFRDDLVDCCVPGDIITVCGVIKSAPQTSYRRASRQSGTFNFYLDANSVMRSQGFANSSSSSSAVRARHVTNADGDGDEDDHFQEEEEENRAQEQETGEDLSVGSAADMAATSSTMRDGIEFKQAELRAIRDIALMPDCFGFLVMSFCQGIFGQNIVKAGLLLSLAAGTPREEKDGVTIRSNIHVLIVGDPGLGKSHMLRFAADVAPRSIYVSANTSSTAGLTVTVTKEQSSATGDVTLEAGALVLADRGVCCLDEFDKMKCDPHGLLEAMEQQQISIAKSGVVATLSSRCAVLAAANPAQGRYDRQRTVSENIKMKSALLSRFDLVFILLDDRNEDQDALLSRHIMRIHQVASSSSSSSAAASEAATAPAHAPSARGEPNDLAFDSDEQHPQALGSRLRASAQRFADEKKQLLPPELLRKYIAYARQYVHPRLTPPAARILHALWLTMRSEASEGRSTPITPRQLESLIRLAQARAKLEMREEVTAQDACDVVDLMQESLLQAYTTSGGQIDFGLTGTSSFQKQRNVFLAALRKHARKDGRTQLSANELRQLFTDIGGQEFDRTLDFCRENGFLLKKGNGQYELNFE